MKNSDKKQKEISNWHILIAGIGALILAMPIYVVMSIKDFFKNTKRKKDNPSHIKRESDSSPYMHYIEPQMTGEDREFITRIREFICFQYKSFNGLSGREQNYQFIASESPELKEYVLHFFEKHPIEELLYGDIHRNGCDMDHWEIRLIFENQNLNHFIRGYGITKDSAPFLRELIPNLFYKQISDRQSRLLNELKYKE